MKSRTPSMPASRQRRRLPSLGLGLLAALALVGEARPAGADNPFSHDGSYLYACRDDCPLDEFTVFLPLGVSTFELYVSVGETPSPAPGTPCHPGPNGGSGDELCSFHGRIQVAGPGYLASFDADDSLGLVLSPEPAVDDSLTGMPTQLDFSFVDIANPLPAGPLPTGVTRLGTLGVAVNGDNVAVTFTGVDYVNSGAAAATQGTTAGLEEFPSSIVGLPEPSSWLLGLSAVAGLVGLGRLRRGRSA